jgi:hypothetical protein
MSKDPIIEVRFQRSTWHQVLLALRASPDAGNYLVAAAILGIEDFIQEQT